MSAPDDISGLTVTAADGQQYFVYGKNRIKIVEHFPESGKTLDELIVNLIHSQIQSENKKSA